MALWLPDNDVKPALLGIGIGGSYPLSSEAGCVIAPQRPWPASTSLREAFHMKWLRENWILAFIVTLVALGEWTLMS